MKTVLVFGTFDILHPGHVEFLKQAKKQGDKLYVVVSRDSTVKYVKGRLPHNLERVRLQKVRDLDIVDAAYLGNKVDKFSVVEKLKPDIICLGYDQKYLTDTLPAELSKRNLNAKIIRLKPFKEHIYKSSKLRPSR
jgi:FAD synthetase